MKNLLLLLEVAISGGLLEKEGMGETVRGEERKRQQENLKKTANGRDLRREKRKKETREKRNQRMDLRKRRECSEQGMREA